MAKKHGLAYYIEWVTKNCYAKDMSRPDTIKKLMDRFDLKYDYARTIVYNNTRHLPWKRAAYPANRKSRSKREIDAEKTKLLRAKFKKSVPKTDAFDGDSLF